MQFIFLGTEQTFLNLWKSSSILLSDQLLSSLKTITWNRKNHSIKTDNTFMGSNYVHNFCFIVKILTLSIRHRSSYVTNVLACCCNELIVIKTLFEMICFKTESFNDRCFKKCVQKLWIHKETLLRKKLFNSWLIKSDSNKQKV